MKIGALATAFPETILSNEALAEQYPEWDFPRLKDRTGVEARHIAGPDETAFDLALAAARNLGTAGNLLPETIDAVLLCTESPDYLVPGNAAMVPHALGLRPSIFCLDINMGCSAYPYLLQVADGLQQCGIANRILILTADTYSRYIHPEDRATRVLFGDGAAATIVEATEKDESYKPIFGARGDLYDRFWIKNGGAKHPLPDSNDPADERRNFIEMSGLKILSFFNTQIPAVVDEILSINNLKKADIDAFIFHQASAAALDSIQRAIDIPDAKMVRAFSKVGNLVSASVPAALHAAKSDGTINTGDLVLLCGFGVGLSWGATIVRL